jgi:hypothetical protein
MIAGLRSVLGALASALLLAGCATPSVHPIYTKDKEATDDRLVGSWRDEDGKSLYAVAQAKAGYLLHIGSKPADAADKPVNSDFELHLVDIGAHRFVDVSASATDRDQIDKEHSTLFVPTHMFARIEIKGDELTAWYLKEDWMRKHIATGAISGTPLDDGPQGSVLITADTEKLQAFLRTHAEDENAWNKEVLRRVKDSPSK